MKKTANRVFISALTAATIFTTACIPVLAAEEAPIILENGKDRSKEENIQAEIRMGNAAKITDEIASGADFPNVMFSPTSLNYALGMLAEGAGGKTKEALNSFLGTDQYGKYAQEYTKSAAERNSSEEEEKNGYRQKLKIANALWADHNWKLKEDYIERVQTDFNAGLTNEDFGDPGKVSKMINDWADEQTEHLIPEIVTPDMISEEEGLVLTNSLYFESPWSEEAWVMSEKKETFKGFDGTEETTYMMTEGNRYFENEQATAFSRYYQNGLQFVGILPKKEGDFKLTDLDLYSLLNSEPEYTQVICKMPALDFTTSTLLEDTLSKMGLADIFSDSADFSGLSETPAKVGSIIQKTNLQLDENGTKAAAVTAIVMEKCALMPEEPEIIKEVTLDRPFAFLIYDEENQEVLFMGKTATTEKQA